MTRSILFFMILAAIILMVVASLLRSRKLREKYAALWIVVGFLSIVLAIFPGLLARLARLVGIAVPANLLFVLAIGLLLVVSLHLSLEISRLEDETRILAENVAILNAEVVPKLPTHSLMGDVSVDVADSPAEERSKWADMEDA